MDESAHAPSQRREPETELGEAMLAIVLADHLLRHRAQCG